MRNIDRYLRRFYRLFNIKPIQLDYPDNMDEFYPEITDEMYIELLLINIKYWRSDYVLKNTRTFATNGEWRYLKVQSINFVIGPYTNVPSMSTYIFA